MERRHRTGEHRARGDTSLDLTAFDLLLLASRTVASWLMYARRHLAGTQQSTLDAAFDRTVQPVLDALARTPGHTLTPPRPRPRMNAGTLPTH